MKLFGKNPVIERLKSNPKSVRKIYIEENHEDLSYVRKKAVQHGIPCVVIPRSKLLKLARDMNTQGIMMDIDEFPYVDYGDLVDMALKKRKVLVFLDGITDPQNLGAIIRSLACLGDFALVLPTHDSVGVTETVLRIACGGENHLSVARVPNLAQAILKARDQGFFVAGTVVEGGTPLTEAELSFPLGLVIGSEQKGIRDVIRKHLDLAITIPMAQQRLSLNVAHATAIFAYEAVRRRAESRRSREERATP